MCECDARRHKIAYSPILFSQPIGCNCARRVRRPKRFDTGCLANARRSGIRSTAPVDFLASLPATLPHAYRRARYSSDRTSCLVLHHTSSQGDSCPVKNRSAVVRVETQPAADLGIVEAEPLTHHKNSAGLPWQATHTAL